MEHKIELKELVSYVMKSLAPEAACRCSFMLNDVAPGLQVDADRETLAHTLSAVLSNSICHAENNCIRISTHCFNQIISLTISQTASCAVSTIAVSMEPLQPLAEKLGGSITVVADNESRVMVAFSFYNGRRAA